MKVRSTKYMVALASLTFALFLFILFGLEAFAKLVFGDTLASFVDQIVLGICLLALNAVLFVGFTFDFCNSLRSNFVEGKATNG